RPTLTLALSLQGEGMLLTMLAVVATACAGPPTAAPVEQAAAQPKAGGYFRHLSPYSPANLDPYTTEDATGYGFLIRMWYEPLLTIDFKPGVDWRIETPVAPNLAESWKQEDATTYSFTIRKGVTFHNGDPLTANDV